MIKKYNFWSLTKKMIKEYHFLSWTLQHDKEGDFVVLEFLDVFTISGDENSKSRFTWKIPWRARNVSQTLFCAEMFYCHWRTIDYEGLSAVARQAVSWQPTPSVAWRQKHFSRDSQSLSPHFNQVRHRCFDSTGPVQPTASIDQSKKQYSVFFSSLRRRFLPPSLGQ